jgi:hypothetical protein
MNTAISKPLPAIGIHHAIVIADALRASVRQHVREYLKGRRRRKARHLAEYHLTRARQFGRALLSLRTHARADLAAVGVVWPLSGRGGWL